MESAVQTSQPNGGRPGDPPDRGGFEGIVGESRAMRDAVSLAATVARETRAPILILGESGTETELFARGIHYAGPEPEKPLLTLHCRSVPNELLASELFGHEAGGIRGARNRKRGLVELAGTGTVVLDGVSELPGSLQAKLLWMLQTGTTVRSGGTEKVEVKCRIVAVADRSLEEAVRQGRFREDLFCRLGIYKVEIPPLRQRPEDIQDLARHVLARLGRETISAEKRLTPEAIRALESHHWPGNVRELRSVLSSAIQNGEDDTIGAEDLRIQVRWRRPVSDSGDTPFTSIHIPSKGKSLEKVEGETIQATLHITDGNQSAAARILGISRPTLARKIDRYDLWVPGRDEPPPGWRPS